MAIIKQKNKKTGITYVIESESYWDKEKQQPRSHRRIIGKIDEATGEVVPTRSKRAKSANAPEVLANKPANEEKAIPHDELELRIQVLEKQVAQLQREKEDILSELRRLTQKYSN